MPEQLTATSHGITLCHESFGDRADPSLLLVMGLGTQMVAWHDDFCTQLAERGFHVTRFDNRDVGRSTHLAFPPPKLGQLISRRLHPEQYSLDDMATDAAALIESLELGAVHLVGASMGAMIGQVLAAREPHLVRSLVSIMSNTGSRFAGQPALRMYRILLKRAPAEREGFVEHAARLFELIGSAPELRSGADDVREIAARSFDRGHDPAGAGRQLGAIVKTGNRTRLLRQVGVPALVIHGRRDRLVRPSGGRATARAIPGARLELIDGMGHDLPRALWPRFIDAIIRNADRAASDRGRGARLAA